MARRALWSRRSIGPRTFVSGLQNTGIRETLQALIRDPRLQKLDEVPDPDCLPTNNGNDTLTEAFQAFEEILDEAIRKTELDNEW
jgi:hypothetical protein